MNCKFISTSDRLFSLPSSSSPATSRIKSRPDRLSFNNQAFPLGTSSGSTRRFRVNAVVAAAAPTTESFYDLLGVPASGSLPEIKRAYKRMALKYHPDVSPPDRTEEYTQRFLQVQEAYQTLSDPETRAMYDSDMAMGFHNPNVAFTGRTGRGRGRGSGTRFDRSMWQSQINELKKKSEMNRVTWGSRVRRQRSERPVNGF